MKKKIKEKIKIIMIYALAIGGLISSHISGFIYGISKCSSQYECTNPLGLSCITWGWLFYTISFMLIVPLIYWGVKT